MTIQKKPFSSANRWQSRQDPDVARFVMSELLPDAAERGMFEELLAEIIEVAANKSDRAWVVPLFRRGVALNVGRGNILDLARGGRVTFYALADGMPDALLERIEQHRPDQGPYKSDDPVTGFQGSFEIFADLLPDARPFIAALADRWTGMKSIWRESHSPGVVEYLEQELRRSLPRPAYVSSRPEAVDAEQGVHSGEEDVSALFSWRPIYAELAQRLSEFSSDRQGLLGMLRRLSKQGLKVVSLDDWEEENGPAVQLEDIDPFSFFACFNRGLTEANRTAVLDGLRQELELESPLPQDYTGIPLVHNQAAKFMGFSHHRGPDDLDRLWSLAVTAVEGGREAIDAEDFDSALEQVSVGMTKLTSGLFWVNPEQFLSVDRPMMAYLEQHGLGPKPTSWAEYAGLLDEVQSRLGLDFPMISYLAWAEGSPEADGRRYWAGGIQWGGSPDGDKLEEFLREGYWQPGYRKDTDRPAGKRCWERIRRIRPGDRFALKGIGGRNDLVVHAIGEVRGVDTETGRVGLQILKRDVYRDKAPTGPGAGPWRETLLEVTRKDVIDEIFGTVEAAGRLAAQSSSRLAGGLDSSFSALEARLIRRGFSFPSELIASYLLALQAKRFVILTGISGTGKTQLAIEVAKHFGLDRGAPEVPKDWEEDPHVRRVVPTLFKHGSTIIPRAFERAEPEFMEHARVQKRYPLHFLNSTEPWEASIWFHGDDGVSGIRFPKPLRDLLPTELEVGDLFRLDVEEDPKTGFRLHFQKVGSESAARNTRARYVVVAVRPDWTDNRGLLGYHNPITDRYHVTPFLRLLLEADEELQRAEKEGIAARPYFAVLDEMNLARVEHYFSDFLSCLESREPLVLHECHEFEDEESRLTIPPRLKVPTNLFFTGTVNVDETTYMFSPKVLDRAFALEFNQVDLRGLSRDGAGGVETPLRLTGLPSEFSGAELQSARDWQALEAIGWGEAQRLVIELNDLLALEHRHFGYRVATEMARFLCLAQEQTGGGEDGLAAALDVALLSKVLPKLHGTQQELQDVLDALFRFAVGVGDEAAALVDDSWQPEGHLLSWKGDDALEARFPRTAAKLWRMRRRLRRQGFTSFVE